MKGFDLANNWIGPYSYGIPYLVDVVSPFSILPTSWIPFFSSGFPVDLIKKIRLLELHPTEVVKFVDFDNTLLDDEGRFKICPELRELRGKLAYPFIREKFGTNWSNGFKEFVAKLNPCEHLFDYTDFYDPENPNMIILTAWNEELQSLKVEAAFWKKVQKIIVKDAEQKLLAILEYIVKLGYIPGRVIFIDDKINSFNGQDRNLEKILWNQVDFYRAIPNSKDRSVEIQSVRQLRYSIQLRSTELLRK